MYSCMMCETDFTSCQHLYTHLINHKNTMGCWNRNCDHISKTRKERKNHMKKHKTIPCNICEKMCEKLHLFDHKKSHEYLYSIDQLNGIVDKTIPPEERYHYHGNSPICPVKNCSKIFQNQNELIEHFIEHRRNHLCEFCREIFPSVKTRREHVRKKICRYYSCFNCRKDFSFEKFIRHIMECAECYSAADADAECSLQSMDSVAECSLQSMDSAADAECSLNNNNAKPIEIPNENVNDCVEMGINRKMLYEIFGDSVIFQCNVCTSKFVQYQYLMEHCKLHNHDLIFCSKCYFMFDAPDELRKHSCFEYDYNLISEMKFRRKFRKNRYSKNINRPKKININIWDTKNMTDVIEKLGNIKFPERKTDEFDLINTNVIKKLENIEFPERKVTSTSDEFDLNKILPRIIKRRQNRTNLFPVEVEVEKIEDNLNNLIIRKKPLFIHMTINEDDDDDELINNIDKFLEDLEGPPNKKIKTDTSSISSNDDEFLDEFNLLIDEAQQDISDDEIPEKKAKY